MSDMIAKSYNSIKELPSEVRSSFDERDQKKWMDAYNKASESKEPEQAKVDAWMSMVDAPSSLAVETWGSVEVRDADGELVPVKTIEEYADKFIENGGLMHDSHSNVPVGTVWDYEVRKHPETGQDGIVFYFNIYRDGEVFERARDDILSGRKNAVSIGAEAPRGGYKCDDRGCYVERDVTDLYELSICETPANPEAYFINVGKDIAKAKTPIDGEVFRIGIKDVVVHQDYTTCPLQKCKHDLIMQGFEDVHIDDDGKIIAKSKNNEFNLFKAIKSMDYPFRYDLKKEQFEIMPDYGVEQAIEEAIENGWAHTDQVGHVCLTKEIPKEVFIDWYDRGFIVKIGDFYCLKADDVAKNGMKKEWTDAYSRLVNALDSIITRAVYYEEGNYVEDDRRELYRLFEMLDSDNYIDVDKYRDAINTFDRNCTTDVFKEDIQICMSALDEIYEQNLKDAEDLVNRMLDGIEEGYRKRQMHEWFNQTFGKMKKDNVAKKKVKKSVYEDNDWIDDEFYGDKTQRQIMLDYAKRVGEYMGSVQDGRGERRFFKMPDGYVVQICIDIVNDSITDIWRTSDFSEWNFPDLEKSAKKKVKKDGGAMGVGDAGASNPIYGSKPTSLVTPTGDKKYGKKKKTKKEFTDDGNIHAVGSRQAKKSYGNFFDAVENFIVDSPEGVYYNDILDEFSDALDEDDILDALEQICSDGAIIYDDRTERFKVGKKIKKSFAIFNPDDEIEMFDGKELIFDKKEDAEYVLASDEFPDGWYCTEIGDDKKPLFKNVKKSVNSIEKKCPKGKWKDKKTGECITIEE